MHPPASLAAAAALALALGARSAAACGFTIHMTVTHRALNHFFSGPPASFGALLAGNRGAVEGGSPYPDYGYQWNVLDKTPPTAPNPPANSP